jgi:acyl-ACP thioesterase
MRQNKIERLGSEASASSSHDIPKVDPLMRFQNKQYVRWGDLDAFGHVNNATYLIYAQEARFAWSKMLEMVVARAEVDFIYRSTPVILTSM